MWPRSAMSKKAAAPAVQYNTNLRADIKSKTGENPAARCVQGASFKAAVCHPAR